MKQPKKSEDKNTALPRKSLFMINDYELGWLSAAISQDLMRRMEKECPIMWLQFQVAFNDVYARSKGHPFQKQAIEDKVRYEAKLITLLQEEKK